METKNEKTVLVSFCIPTYKFPIEKLPKCMDSILDCGLSKDKFEMVIVSDGNTREYNSELEKFIVEYSEKNDIIVRYVVHTTNLGLFEARKSAARVATGKYICHVDSDDWIEKDCLKDLPDFLGKSEYDYDIIQYGYETIYTNKQVKPSGKYSKYTSYIAADNSSLLRFCIIDGGIPRYIWGKLISRQLYKKLENILPDVYVNFAEDFLALVFLTSYSKSYCYREDIKMYNYSRLDESMTSHVKKIGKEKWNSLLSVANVIEITKLDNFRDADVKAAMAKSHLKYSMELYSLLTLDNIFESDEIKKYAVDSFVAAFGEKNVANIEKTFKEMQKRKKTPQLKKRDFVKRK